MSSTHLSSQTSPLHTFFLPPRSALEEAGSDRTRAVLRSNRAAAHLASGSYADALVDSLAAQSLDDSYARSFQRSAEAYAAVGDYASAHQSLVELHR